MNHYLRHKNNYLPPIKLGGLDRVHKEGIRLYEGAIPALLSILSWPGPLYLILGSLLGLLFGIIPGLGGPQVLALLLPVTLTMEPHQAIVILIGAMGAIPFGGSVSAILINTPGTGQSAATIFDGFPLAKNGKAGMAIGAAATASLLGSYFGALILTLILPFGRYFVLAFSYPEYFMMAIMGLSVIAVVSKGSLWKGLIGAGLGLLFASVGFDPITGQIRYAFGSNYLYDGIKLVPAMIGLFAISEAISLIYKRESIAQNHQVVGYKDVFEGIVSVFKNMGTFFRGSIIGTLVGIIPGVGGSVANFVAYGHVAQTAKDNSNFGKGDIRGVIAPESSNNAKDGGSLVPTLIFGIPGSVEMAILLGALILHGIQPGPRLMIDNPEIVLVLIFALVLSNTVVSVIGIGLAGPLSKLTLIPGTLLGPLILTIALIASYMTDESFGDMMITLFFGLLGFTMNRYNFSRVALVIALVLGEMLQQTLFQTIKVFGVAGFFMRPLSLILFIVTVSLLISPYIKGRKSKSKRQGDDFSA